MRAVIIAGGNVKDYEYIKREIKKSDTIICADSGYNHAIKMELSVDVLVGDFDSIGEIPKDINMIEYPTKKDYTDTEIAIHHAREMGFKEFLIVGGIGSRMDHTLTNILLLKDFLDRNEFGTVIDENNKIFIINKTIEINEPKGSIVSLIPISDCSGVTTTNLEYPLCNSSLYVGKGLGVSNVMLKDNATISITSGLLLVIIAKD